MMVIGTPTGQLAIDAATRRSGKIFVAYIALLIVSALLIALFTWLTWDAGNRVQDAVISDANARIGEAKSTAAQADATAKALQKDNLTLQGKVAALQTDASNARAAQQHVQIELAKQQTIAANAEKDLANLRKVIAPRRLTPEQIATLTKLLSMEPKGSIGITCVMGDGEGNAFATQIDGVLKAAGWAVVGGGVSQAAYTGGDPIGIGIAVHSVTTVLPYIVHLQQAFFSIGIPLQGVVVPSTPEGNPTIIVGHKPSPPPL